MAGDLTTDPRAYFDSLSEAEQRKTFTTAGAQAIRDGADLGQVVNARRGMYTAGSQKFTREGTTRSGLAGRRSPRTARRMPEQIYADTATREDAIRDLRRYGYIT